MSKSKSTSKSAKTTTSDVLTKVKDAAITKPAQTVKAKAKDLAKQVAAKEEKKDKKSKKKVKEPTPDPSESEESDSSESSGSDSESEEETKTKSAANGKANGVKKPAAKDDSSDESDSDEAPSSESDADSDASEPEAKAPKMNGKSKNVVPAPAKDESSSDESDESDSESDASMADAAQASDAASSDEDSGDDSSDESSEDEKPAKKVATKTAKIGQTAKNDSDSVNSGSDAESDSSDDNVEEKVAAKPTKRKAEVEAEPVVKKSKTETVDTSRGANLFVGNLSWNVDEAWLREVFEEFGELSGVRLMTDRQTGRSKGFGYVEFVNAEDASKAHSAKAGADLDGRSINVDFANARPDNSQKQENRRKSYGDQVSELSDTLFLGNLSFEVGQETVTEAFAPHGTILGIRLPTDRETGQPKGFGYVTFSSADEAKIALEAMQGAYIEGRPVRLDFSAPRPQNSDSPARGRGGFGGRGGARGGRGGRGGSFGGRGGRGGGRGGSTNRGGFGDFSGRKTSFD